MIPSFIVFPFQNGVSVCNRAKFSVGVKIRFFKDVAAFIKLSFYYGASVDVVAQIAVGVDRRDLRSISFFVVFPPQAGVTVVVETRFAVDSKISFLYFTAAIVVFSFTKSAVGINVESKTPVGV